MEHPLKKYGLNSNVITLFYTMWSTCCVLNIKNVDLCEIR